MLVGFIKCNEMNGVLRHICAHIGQTGIEEPPEDGDMNEVTLPSKHMIRNLALLVCSTLTLAHGGCPQYSIFTIEQGGNILLFET